MASQLAYLRLLRLPNVFTAIADVLAGFLLVRGSIDNDSAGLLLGLCLASAMLYSAGMVLNDVFDIEVDRRERPERPLPAGEISLGRAAAIGLLLLVGGVLMAAAAPALGGTPPAQRLAPGVVALLLALFVLGYDGALKKTLAGPLIMGCCRGLNLLLGMSAVTAELASPLTLGLSAPHYYLALCTTLYITGLTWFARDEAERSKPLRLSAALALMMIGVGLLALFPQVGGPWVRTNSVGLWTLLVVVLGATIVRPFLAAIKTPDPPHVQAAIKHGIVSLITLDATIALCGATHPLYALAVLALVFPMRLLGRAVYST